MRKWLLALGLLCAAAPAHATICPSVPYTFSNGAVADATQVNADFTTILSCINANVAKSGINSDITSLTALTTLFASGLGAFGSLTSSGDVTLSGTGELQLPVGTTGQRSGSPAAGMVRVNTTTGNPEGYGLYGDTSWQNIGVPSHAVMAFNLASCPTGWVAANGSGGTADARGRAVRGLDSGAGRDPTGTGLAGGENSAVGPITLSVSPASVYVSGGGGLGSGGTAYVSQQGTSATCTNCATETRMDNVVLLYCEKL